MDDSFDAFGTSARGGWGAETSYGDLDAGPKINTTTPLPVTITDLLEVGQKGEENFTVGKYAFNTVSLVGKVVSVRFEQNGAYMTYGLVDPKDSANEVLSVVQYVNDGAQGEETDLHVGSMARAIGKIRLYDNRLTMTSFHIRRFDDPKQVELADREAKLAKIYYGKDIPSMATSEMGRYQNTIFSPDEPQPKDRRVGANGGAQQPVLSQLQRQQQVGRSPMVSANMGRMSINTPSQQRQQPQQIENGGAGDNGNSSRELSVQQGKILDYIRENDHGGGGISTDQIRQALNLRGDVRSEIQCLLDAALIFTTTGEDHYSAI